MGCFARTYPFDRHCHSKSDFEGRDRAPSVDVAMVFPDSLMSKYLTIPADVVAAAGEAGMGIEVSVYRGE